MTSGVIYVYLTPPFRIYSILSTIFQECTNTLWLVKMSLKTEIQPNYQWLTNNKNINRTFVFEMVNYKGLYNMCNMEIFYYFHYQYTLFYFSLIQWTWFLNPKVTRSLCPWFLNPNVTRSLCPRSLNPKATRSLCPYNFNIINVFLYSLYSLFYHSDITLILRL